MDEFDEGRKAILPQNPADFRQELLRRIDAKMQRFVERASLKQLQELQHLFESLEALRKARSN